MQKSDLLTWLRAQKLAVIGTTGDDGPQGAVVGIAVTDAFEIVFDTVTDSRKHANLLKHPRASLTIWHEETTVQLEGIAHPVSVTAASDASYRDAYYAAWPDGRDRLNWPKITYWRITPVWARYSDFAKGPLIEEFRF
jgi:pyridoxine/pyridoxamine 5'-phosphate oxidase